VFTIEKADGTVHACKRQSKKFISMYIPIRSYRYTVAMFPLPYKNVLKHRTRENVGGISIVVFNMKCTTECSIGLWPDTGVHWLCFWRF
jgi:hypothetical protein